MASSGLLFLALSFIQILVLQFNISTAQTEVYEICDIGGNYTANSTFEANLKLLLSSISTFNIPSINSIYYAAEGSPDRVYGLFQCTGDYASESCMRCAETATSKITTQCPFRKEAVAFYDTCLLRYSDKSFIKILQLEPTVYLYNTANVSEPDRFTVKLAELMRRLVTQATNSSKLFSAGEESFTALQTGYGLVQCTQDLNRTDCNRCLRNAISAFPMCCDGKQGGQVLKPSCRARYEIYPFFEPGTITTPPGPPPFPGTTSPNRTNDNKGMCMS
ncbi:hypothetical protein ACHQM5_003764 [Ranunculus cassubicifolius]